MNISSEKKPKWERVLWKKQPYPDNYVEKDFIRVQKRVDKISVLQAYYGCTVITQEISCCFGLVAAFGGLSSKELHPRQLTMLTTVICALTYFIARRNTFISFLFGRTPEKCHLGEEFKVIIFAIVLCWVSSPLIKTLTESVATDTIQATTTALLCLHLLFHNYGVGVSICNPTMSCNLGLFASVCLASRLQNHEEVFALTLIAVVLFTLVPSFRKHCQESFGKLGCLFFTTCMFGMAAYGVWCYHSSLWFIFLVVTTMVNVVAPTLFLYLQPYRQNIYGPWDEALIKETLILKSS